MANIINAPDLPSEDEEDVDYDPTRDPEACQEEPAPRKKVPLTGRRKRERNDEESKVYEDEESDEEQERAERLISHPKAASKKAKVDAAWNQLKQVTQKNKEDHKERAGEDAGKDSTCSKPSGISWGLLCRPAARKLPSEDRNRNWMLQLGFQRKASQPGSSSEAAPSAVEPQQRRAEAAASGQGADADQFQQQGNSTTGEPASTGHGLDGHIMASAVSGDNPQAEISGGVTGSTQVSTPKRDISLAAAAIAAAKDALSSAGQGKVSITETRRFAGKNIQMTKSVAAAEAEAEKQKRNKAGLDAVLASLQAAKKVNVLDKSRSDWKDFKRSDSKVEDELEAYKKSSDKYLDKVDFLKRAELREYEKERDSRMAGDIRSRGRL